MFALVSSALVSSALVSVALAAPCPPPSPSLAPAPVLTPDGAANVLARDAATTCWWIVDDGGDARVAARWERARRDPTALAALADGRVVFVLHERGEADRWRIAVRAEGAPEQRLRIELPSPPVRLVADAERPLVALVWPRPDADEVWVVDVAAGRTVASVTVPAAHGDRLDFDPASGALLVDGGPLDVRPWRDDVRR